MSIILICLVHYLFQYLKDVLTVPKIKYIINEPIKKYQNIYEIINQEKNHPKNNQQNLQINHEQNQQINHEQNQQENINYSNLYEDSTPIEHLAKINDDDLIPNFNFNSNSESIHENPTNPINPINPTNPTNNMKNELKNFLKKQMKQGEINSNIPYETSYDFTNSNSLIGTNF